MLGHLHTYGHLRALTVSEAQVTYHLPPLNRGKCVSGINDTPPLSVLPWNALDTSGAIHNIDMYCTITNTTERVK